MCNRSSLHCACTLSSHMMLLNPATISNKQHWHLTGSITCWRASATDTHARYTCIGCSHAFTLLFLHWNQEHWCMHFIPEGTTTRSVALMMYKPFDELSHMLGNCASPCTNHVKLKHLHATCALPCPASVYWAAKTNAVHTTSNVHVGCSKYAVT